MTLFDEKMDEIKDSLNEGCLIEILTIDNKRIGIIQTGDEVFTVVGVIKDVELNSYGELRAFVLGVLNSLKEFEAIPKEIALAMVKAGKYK